MNNLIEEGQVSKSLEQLLKEIIVECQAYTRLAQKTTSDYKFVQAVTFAAGLKK